MKIIVFACFIWLLPSQVWGQFSLSVGIGGGFAFSNTEIDAVIDGNTTPSPSFQQSYEWTSGAQFHVPVEMMFGSHFGVQPEIMFSRLRGRQVSSFLEGGTDFGIEYNSVFDYNIRNLEIPVLAKLALGENNIRFHVLAGPSVGFGIGGNTRIESYQKTYFLGVPTETTTEAEGKMVFVKDGFNYETEVQKGDSEAINFPAKRLNVHVHLGLGASFQAGPMRLFFDARYMMGLTDLYPDGYSETNGERTELQYEGKSRRIGATIGVLVPLVTPSKAPDPKAKLTQQRK